MSSKRLILHVGHVIEKIVPGLITCAEADTFIDDYIEGRLSPKINARFERHIRMCQPCRSYLEAYRRGLALVKASAADDAAAKMPEELIQAILAARDPSRH